LQNRLQLGIFAKFTPSFAKLPKLQTPNAKPLDTLFGAFWQITQNANLKCKTLGDALRASPTIRQLDFTFLKFAKNLKNCSPAVFHLTYTFWQTWHLIDQTWHFCIGTMGWQFWYPENLRLLIVPVLPTSR